MDDTSAKEKKKSVKDSKDKSKSKDSKDKKSVKDDKKKKKDPKSPRTPESEADKVSRKSSKKTEDLKKEEQIPPIDGQLQRIEDQLKPKEKNCVHHDLILQFFCESCEEPICRQCTILGPHNNQLHRINKVEEAFRARVAKLSDSIKNNLLDKRDQLLAQIHRIEYRIEEIRYIKTIIERDVRAEYGGIIERLKSAEGIKVAVLQHEMSEIQKDLDRINDLGNAFNELSKDPSDPINFLLRARNLYENLEFLVSKPYKANIDVYPYDLPRELTEMRLQLQKVNAQKALIEFKNEIIWRLVEEKKQTEESIKKSMEEAAYEELQEWSKLTDKFSNELRKYQLVCFYCGVPLEEQTVNKKCKENTKALDPDFKGYCEEVPDSKNHGNHRHYFARPNNDIVDMIHQAKSNQLKNVKGKTPFIVFIEIQFSKIQKASLEKNLDLAKMFKDHDKKSNGTVNHIQFKYLMTEMMDMQIQEVDKIIKFLDNKQTGFIQYEAFLNMLNNPELIDTIQIDQQDNEQLQQ